ncbi:hypothetical protein UFOVP116_77 [uncultured Caudovirales phage]|uniref:Uncharacterized protein n=1 Tax=uncultured Caudovirales phage TaxID=2100421 RepID=A0A6J5L8L8_9CAUD|nr:hypothetical protein UFOVP116_77 [uncultured Caudovirales phage]
MKIIEITNGLLYTLTNEEAAVLRQFSNFEPCLATSLSDRQQYISENLVRKELLITFTRNGKTYYAKASS